MTAGDAKQVNAATHTIHPWPRYVGDRRIAYDARRTGPLSNAMVTPSGRWISFPT